MATSTESKSCGRSERNASPPSKETRCSSRFNPLQESISVARFDNGCLHKTIALTILYFDTPVALISSLNEDGTANLAPMSSA